MNNTFTINVLGTASAQPTASRYSSAQVLSVRGRFFLLDCCEGVQILLRRAHKSFHSIENICLTHVHGDHVLGIFGLLSSFGLQGRTDPLHIYAPENFQPILDFYRSQFGTEDRYEIVFHPLSSSQPEVIFQTRSFSVTAIPLRHRIPTYGYVFREKLGQKNVDKNAVKDYEMSLHEIACLKNGEDVIREDGTVLRASELTYYKSHPRSYAYITDTAPFDELPDWIGPVDVLYHEATYPEEKRPNARKYFHSTARDAATDARKAGARKLYLGHYSSAYADLGIFQDEAREVFPETYLATEGDIIEI